MLEPLKVDLYLLDLDIPATPSVDEISKAESQRADALENSVMRNRFIQSRKYLRNVLAPYLGCSPAQIEFGKRSSGKPYISAPESRILYNLSHSGSALAIVVAERSQVGQAFQQKSNIGEIPGLATIELGLGVDIEIIKSGRDFRGIARRFFSVDETAWIEAVQEPESRARFYEAWVAKEAIVKSLGDGIFSNLERFSVLSSTTKDSEAVVQPATSLTLGGSDILFRHIPTTGPDLADARICIAVSFKNCIASRRELSLSHEKSSKDPEDGVSNRSGRNDDFGRELVRGAGRNCVSGGSSLHSIGGSRSSGSQGDGAGQLDGTRRTFFF